MTDGIIAADEPEVGSSRPVPASFVFEQHLGHRTYAENLERASLRYPSLDVRWTRVTYEPAGPLSGFRVVPPGLRSALAGRRQVLQGLRGSPCDVVVFNTQVPAALGGRRARRRPYIVITDVTPAQYDRMADDYEQAGSTRIVERGKHEVNRRVFGGAAACVGWSEWAAESIRTEYEVPPHLVHVIPPGVDTTLLRPKNQKSAGPPMILFVGGDFARKGGDLLLEAFASLPAELGAELILVTKADVPRMNRVRVLNDLSPNDPRLIDLFCASDVFVLPSRAETFGIAAAEASAAGLPVIASRTGGLAEIVIDGETGLTVAPGVIGDLTRALTLLVADAGLRQRMGVAARAHAVRSFDDQVNANRLFDLVRRSAGSDRND